MLGKIKSIEEIFNFTIQPITKMDNQGKSLGMTQMINALCGYSSMDGYKVETEKHVFYVLIDNGQSCCENWGYMSSEDDLNYFIGSELIEINVTDTALNKKVLTQMDEELINSNEIQFVDFKTNNGTFQLAVYNSHNGYYGHGILVAKDNEILLNEVL
jgi:hypothetical protein